MSRNSPLLSVAIALFALALPLGAQLAEGDEAWARRAEGHQGTRVKPEPVEASLTAYAKAAASSPNDLEPRWRLLRSYWFKASFVSSTPEEKKKYFEQAKKAGDEAMAVLGRHLASRGMSSPDKASEQKIADAARTIPGAAELYCWNAANWGEWAVVFGKLAAVRQGAADRIRRDSTIAMLIDPKAESGCGARILGRLHNQSPRVPFVTGWASDTEAVRFLRDSLASDPDNKLTKVFLAEAMVAADVKTKPQARKLLEEVLATPVLDFVLVEDLDAQRRARDLLASWK